MTGSFYFPSRLLEKLERMSRTPVTVVAAPAGYGKTTIVVKKTEESGLRTLWFDSEELIAHRRYDRICGEFEKISPALAADLIQLGPPKPDNASELMNLLHRHESMIEECIVVFDNFQILQTLLPDKLLSALLRYQGRSLHLVFLTSNMWEGLIFDRGTALLINIDNFSIEPAEIMHYFRAGGIEISAEEVAQIFAMTDGWNLAIYSLLQMYIYSTVRITESEIETCLNRLIHSRYGSELYHTMLCLNPFACFTDETVRFVLDDDTVSARVLSKLKSTPLITYSLITREYYPHPTVSRCFRSLLDDISVARRSQIFRRAGEYYGSLGKATDQLSCYGESEDDERILQMDQVTISDCLEGDQGYTLLIESILKRCPLTILFKYPLSLLCFVRHLFAAGKTDLARSVAENLVQYAEENDDRHLLGEIALVRALSEFPRIHGVCEELESATALLDGQSSIFQPGGSFLCGYPSMISLFYLVPGSADKVADELEEAFRILTDISKGQGAGADLLFRGELALMRCQLDEALIFAYKAEAAAGSHRQYGTLAGAALLKGYISLARKDQRMLNESLNYLNKLLQAAEGQSMPASFCERVNASLKLLLHLAGRPGRNPVGDLPAAMNFPQDGMLLIAFLVRLLDERQYARLISIVESLAEPLKQAGVIQWIDSQLLLAFSYAALGKRETGVWLVEEAFKIAQQDQILYPFSIRSTLLSEFLPDRLLQRISQGADRELWLATSQQKLAKTLTDREREVAVLAAGGLRNREIAEKLYLSEGTVRNHLSIIYQKLEIDRRSKLSDYEHTLLKHDKTHDIDYDD